MTVITIVSDSVLRECGTLLSPPRGARARGSARCLGSVAVAIVLRGPPPRPTPSGLHGTTGPPLCSPFAPKLTVQWTVRACRTNRPPPFCHPTQLSGCGRERDQVAGETDVGLVQRTALTRTVGRGLKTVGGDAIFETVGLPIVFYRGLFVHTCPLYVFFSLGRSRECCTGRR